MTTIGSLIFLILVAITVASNDEKKPEDLAEANSETHSSHREVRGYADYDSWKPSASSTPDVILIKQKDPDDHHHHHDGHHSSISSVFKDNLPLFAVLAPLAAAAVLFPLKAYFGASYVLFPPATPAPAPASKKRVGKEENDVVETQTMAGQVLQMIEKLDKLYSENAVKQKKRK
ncbi:hypothetical protein JTE90_007940 [Oedothorax gibbosus]|uniref:Transmembrane protein n=1 Tax=Oedothorax gibbosus TaxID=931172 RepID=A0AAV6VHF3_9ARAC|nr:hypothetical protein JTE90_007940 [Oedothorax gibbosus]